MNHLLSGKITLKLQISVARNVPKLHFNVSSDMKAKVEYLF